MLSKWQNRGAFLHSRPAATIGKDFDNYLYEKGFLFVQEELACLLILDG